MLKTNYKLKSRFWRYIPIKRYAIFAGAIFFLFSGIGFISDLIAKGSFSGPLLFVNAAYSGLVAVFYVYTFTRNIKFLPVTLLFQFAVGFYAWKGSAHLTLEQFQSRAAFDAYGILASIILGYLLLIIFMTREGIRNLRYQTEMNLARDLHSNLVPKVDIKNSNFEIYGVSKPTEEVGGDLIDFFENEEASVCCIADVSGHGVAAGSMMGMFKSAIRVLLNDNKPLGSILIETSKTLYHLKKKNMFITCAFLKFNLNNTVEFTTAGHLPVLKLPADSDVYEEMVIKQLPVAAAGYFDYRTDLAGFKKGDLFILLTDGITETNNKLKEEFGLQKVKEIIFNHRKETLSGIYENINKKISSFGRQKDDQTILLIRCL